MTLINAEKAVVYAVEQAEQTARAEKAVLYVVEQPVIESAVEKAVVYAVEQADATGNAKQSIAGSRPIYASGARPCTDFSAGQSLGINVLSPGAYTLILYKPDDTFTVQTLTLVAGLNDLPSVDFNQAVLVPGSLSVIATESIKSTMRTRVVASAI